MTAILTGGGFFMSKRKEIVHQADIGHLFREILPIWIVSRILFAFCFLLFLMPDFWLSAFLITIAILIVFVLPAILLVLNHVNYTADKLLVIKSDCISLEDRVAQQSVTLVYSDITAIVLVDSWYGNQFLWGSAACIVLVDRHEQTMVIPEFLMAASALWQNSLTRKLNTKAIQRKSVFYLWLSSGFTQEVAAGVK